jgi:hypothetical protein
MAFPTDAEITIVQNSTYNSGSNTGSSPTYFPLNNENPADPGKIRGILYGLQQLITYVKNTVDVVINNKYRLSVTLSTPTGSLSAGAYQVITFDSKKYDLNTNYINSGSAGSNNNYGYTAPVSGYYMVNAMAHANPQSTSGAGEIYISRYNASNTLLERYRGNSNWIASSSYLSYGVSRSIYLNAGEYIKIEIKSTVNSFVIFGNTSEYTTWLTVDFLGF